jgi:PAS domain S-box-containing protein
MSSADRKGTIGTFAYWLHTWPQGYGIALIAVAVATLLRSALNTTIGPNLSFLLFYPVIWLVAWMAGMGPGVFAVVLSAASAEYLLLGRATPTALSPPLNASGLAMLLITGIGFSGLADRYRRRAERLREFERAAAGVEEGIIILDRRYRYVVANRVFLGYRGVSREQLIGHSLAETMGESVFETTVKPRLDEAFKGKVVKFQKRYKYPTIGERDFSVSYFPIEGPTGVDRVACILQDITEQKQAEHDLKLFRTLIDQSNDAVQVVDPETLRFLDVNEKACKDLGYSREELLAMTVFDINPKVDESSRAQVLERVREFGFVVQEGVHRRKDGSIFPVETSLRYVQLDRTYVVAVSRDITERKRAEDALHEREEKFYQVADNIQEIFWMVDTATKQAIYVNPAFERITGRTVASLLNDPLSYREIIHVDDRLRVLERLNDAAITGKLDEEFRIVRPDGTIRWVAAHGFPVRSAEGEIYRLAGVVEDITERRVAEGALRESEDRCRDLVEHSEDLVCTHDLEGNLLSVNPTPARLLGYEVAEFLKIPMRELIVPEYRALFDGYLARMKANGADKGLLCVMARTGEHRIWEYNNTLRTEGVAMPIVRGMAHDVTEKRRAESALSRREEDYRRFVAQSSEGIFREDLDAPVSIDLPEDELIHRIIHDSYLAECNDAMAKMYGFTSGQELLGKRLTEMLVADDPRNIEMTREYIRSGFRVLDRESHEVDVHGNPKVFRNSMMGVVENGKLVRTWGIQRDVTEHVKAEAGRSKAERSLAESEERFRVALKDSPITVFNQDRDLRYTWIYNANLYWKQEALGRTDAEIIGPKDAASLVELKRRVLKTGVAVREDVVIPHEGRNHALDITIEPLFDADGGVIGITGTSMDIARFREMTDRLQDARDKLAQEKLYLESEIQTELGFKEIIGQSPALREVLKDARVVAPTDSTVLLLGETGTGKELVARSVHALSSRRDKTFIKLNCAAVPEGLLESELFGHERGAFTGAVSQKVGRIELADKGTLFLDEIGELPLELQPKLLRVLQDREFERLGGVNTLHVDVRIISATNRDLRQDIADRKFREDLFYRLNVFPICLPALRERRTDIPMLVRHFVQKHSARMGRHIDTVPDATMTVLQKWNWPGNIRELENMIERMVILSKGRVLAAPPVELDSPQEVDEDNLSEMEREHIIRVLRETNGVLSGTDGAARRLGIKRTTLQSMLKRFGIELQEYRRGTGTFGPN